MAKQTMTGTAIEVSDDEVLAEATTVTNAETVLGGEIDCGAYNRITFYFDYVNATETNVAMIVKTLLKSGGTEYPYMEWVNSSGVHTQELSTFVMSVSGGYTLSLDVSGITLMKLYQNAASGGVFDGTIAVRYMLTED